MLPDLSKVIYRGFADISVFSILINLFLLVPAIYMMQVYDRVLPSSSLSTLLYISLIAVAALSFLATMDAIRSIYCQRLALFLDKTLAEFAFRASMSTRQAGNGDIEPLRDLAAVRGFVASKGLTNLFDLPFAPIFATILFFIHPILCAVTVTGALVLLLMVAGNQLAAKSRSTKAAEAAAAATLLAQAMGRNGETVRSMGMIGNATNYWGMRFASAALLQDATAEINSVFAGLSRTLRMGLQLAILGTGAILVMKHQMTGGMIFASSTISGRTLQPIDQLVAGWRQVAEASKAWQRLKATIRQSNSERETNLILPAPKGRLSVKGLSWSPTTTGAGAKPVLKNVTFDVAQGDCVAILGASGAGKSTLAKLLAGVLNATDGLIQLDGADYRTWNSDQLGRGIGYLAQEVQLLPGTIAENISRFGVDVPDTEIVDAARRAMAHEMITALPKGYQTQVAKADGLLSGGMRQRVGLARALFGKCCLLVLDEPNSNLDADGETALDQALTNAKAEGITVFLATHKLSLVRRCDKALVLRNGEVAGFDTAGAILQGLSLNDQRRRRSADIRSQADVDTDSRNVFDSTKSSREAVSIAQ